MSTGEGNIDGLDKPAVPDWTPPRRVYFKKQMLNLWRVTDSDGQRMVNADQAFAQMQELVEDGWKLEIQESVVGHVLSVTMTEPR